MAQLVKLQIENKKLKDQIQKYKEAYGCCPHVDDSTLKGGYRVVNTLQDRDNIPCCYRKKGMVVVVINDVEPFTEYRLLSDKCENEWELIVSVVEITEADVLLVNEYILDEEALTTQEQLNQFLFDYIQNLTLDHNKLDNLQGGNLTERYHLTKAQHDRLKDLVTEDELHQVAFTGNYNHLNNLPTLFSGDYNDLYNLPVLFSGNYNDLTNKPNLALKLDVPTTEISVSNLAFQHVVLSGTGSTSAKMLISNLPNDNIGNSNLTLISPRVLNTNSYDFSITNLPNKSTDSTFNEFLGKNASGVIARIGYPAFKAQAESWTQAQRTEFSQILNGGFSVGTMAVNLISPPVFERENNDLYIVLRGANLNLHPTERKIEILNATTNAVLAEVPAGQIQTYSSGTELVFYYNFYSLGVGTYKLKITNGVNTYITTHNFQIVASVTNIDLSGNTFDIVTSYSNTLSLATNNTVFFENEIQGSNTASPIFSAKSDELFAQGENWYLEVSVNFSMSPYGSNSANAASLSSIGIGYSNTVNSLVYSTLNDMKLYIYQTSATQLGKKIGSLSSSTSVPHPYSSSVIFIKQGNLLTCISDTQTYSITISNNSGYSLFLQIPNRVGKEVYSAQIIKAYTF